jgi:DNA-binding CsgD family transcriptional regulator
MLKIIADHPQYGREIVERTLDPAAAEYLKNEYKIAFGPEWTITVKATKGQRSAEKVQQLRAEGKTLPEISEAMGLSVNAINQLSNKLREAGLTDKRDPGKPLDPEVQAKYEQIAQLRESGVGPTEIAKRLGLNLNTVRATVYKLRVSGRLPRLAD